MYVSSCYDSVFKILFENEVILKVEIIGLLIIKYVKLQKSPPALHLPKRQKHTKQNQQLIYQTLMFTSVKHLFMSWTKSAHKGTVRHFGIKRESHQTNG